VDIVHLLKSLVHLDGFWPS